MLKGVLTALVTPFRQNEIDFDSLEKLIHHQLDQGIQGFVVCGTTAESPTLSETEKLELLDFVCQKVDGKVPILFGSGSNNTQSTIQLSQKACEYPIDALLVVVPYYNKPPQKGLLAHFQKVADESPKPIVLYNVPGRTQVSLAPETIIELAKHPNIVGIKEADSDLNNFSKYKEKVPEDFALLSGDDESCVNFCLLGGHGVISVCSHIAPKEMVAWVGRAMKNETSVRDDFREQLAWIKSLYISANPIPVKYALQLKGLLGTSEVRLPLVEMEDEQKEQVKRTLSDFQGLLRV